MVNQNLPSFLSGDFIQLFYPAVLSSVFIQRFFIQRFFIQRFQKVIQRF